MSMDRFFTLKYPMKYGRNKTKTMVLLKITFVWVISIAICSPVCILGFVQPSSIYKDGKCVPTVKDFIIYGSVLAFYIPLFIMVITYVLTTNILRNNSKLMRSMEQSRQSMIMRKHVKGSDSVKSEGEYLNPNGNSCYIEISNESAMHSSALIYAPNDLSVNENTLDDDCHQLRRVSYDVNGAIGKSPSVVTSRTVLGGDDVTIRNGSMNMMNDLNHNSVSPPSGRRRTTQRLDSIVSIQSKMSVTSNSNYSKTYLEIPNDIKQSASIESLVSIHGAAVMNEPPEVQEKLSHIELEMDEYLTECPREGVTTPDRGRSPTPAMDKTTSGDPTVTCLNNETETTEACRLRDVNLDTQRLNNQRNCVLRSRSPLCPAREPVTTTTDDNLSNDGSGSGSGSGSSAGEIRELALPSDGKELYVYKVYSPDQHTWHTATSRITKLRAASYSKLPTSDPDSNSHNGISYRGLPKSKSFTDGVATAPQLTMAYLDNCRRESAANRDRRKRPSVNSTKRMVLRGKSNRGPKRAANNEKKASKVLGIIFGVFVTLWTPFFIVNILSATCTSCMYGMSAEMMSTFLWFGWIASLANPIIYTMFNTAFRRAFVKILTCKYPRRRRRSATPESILLTSPTNWISDTRRGTVTVNLN